jgi:hypothetical protein
VLPDHPVVARQKLRHCHQFRYEIEISSPVALDYGQVETDEATLPFEAIVKRRALDGEQHARRREGDARLVEEPYLRLEDMLVVGVKANDHPCGDQKVPRLDPPDLVDEGRPRRARAAPATVAPERRRSSPGSDELVVDGQGARLDVNGRALPAESFRRAPSVGARQAGPLPGSTRARVAARARARARRFSASGAVEGSSQQCLVSHVLAIPTQPGVGDFDGVHVPLYISLYTAWREL